MLLSMFAKSSNIPRARCLEFAGYCFSDVLFELHTRVSSNRSCFMIRLPAPIASRLFAMSFLARPERHRIISLLGFVGICIRLSYAQTGYVYQLDTEYSGANFFSGWDFFTVCNAFQRLYMPSIATS